MTELSSPPTTFKLLGGEYYTSEEVFAREYDRIFSRDWFFAGHVSQLPKKGSFIKFDFGGEEVVVVRGDGDQFHAHLNVCRHRGYRICEGRSGKVRGAFVCSYHQWRFELDGSLSNVPQMADGEYFDYKDYGLRTAQIEVWHGMIFVCLAQEGIEPLASRFREFEETVARFAPESTKLVHEENYQLTANWKVTVENAMECYHCEGTHAALCSVVDVPGLIKDLKSWLAEDAEDGSDLGMGGMKIQKGMQTLSRDGQLLTDKLLGSHTIDDVDTSVSAGVMLMPNFFYAALYIDHWWTLTPRPISATKTEFLYSWYVREDAVEGKDFNVDDLIYMGHTTQTEDNALIERTQSGLHSRFFVPGPIGSDTEPALHDFATDYLKLMEEQ